MDLKTSKTKERWKAKIEKALVTSDFLNGGKLNPKQQKSFQDLLRGVSDMTKHADIRFTDQINGVVDRQHLGRTVLVGASEYTTFVDVREPSFSKGTYALKKLVGGFDVSYETMIENIEKKNYKGHLTSMFMKKAASDIALVSVNGDTGSADPLLSQMNGFYKLSDYGIQYSNGGAEISRRSFLAGYRALPKEVRRKKSQLRWFMNSVLHSDWEEALGYRATAMGDTAVGGIAPAPSKIPILISDEMSDTISVGYTSATYGKHVGTVADSFVFVTGTNDAITVDITIDGAASGDQAFLVAAGTYTAPQLARTLNIACAAAGVAEVFHTDGEGHLVIRSTKTGLTQAVKVTAVANDIYGTIGFVANTYTGTAPSAAGTIDNGTFMWLTIPENFRIYIYSQIRSSYEYKARKDGWEFTMYYMMDPYLVDETAIVRVDDIRLKDYH